MTTKLNQLLNSLYPGYMAPEGDAEGGGTGGSGGAPGAGDGGSGGGASGSTGGGHGGGADDAEDYSDMDLTTLRRILKEERKGNRANSRRAALLEAQLDQLKGLDPKAVEEARRRAEELERRNLEAEQTFKLKEEQLRQKSQSQIEKLTAELQAERAAREEERTRGQVERVYYANKGLQRVAEDGTSAFDIFWGQFRVVFGRDEKGLFVRDKDGDPVIDDETGKRLDVAKHLEKLRQDPLHSRLFEPEYGAGGGSRGGRDGFTRGVDVGTLSTREKFKVAFGRRVS